MKFIRSILVSLVALIGAGITPAVACWVAPYPAKDYTLIRLFDHKEREVNQAQENCRLWQKYTDGEVATDAIYKAVYTLNVDDLELFKQHFTKHCSSHAMMQNGLIQWMDRKCDWDAFNLLVLAKRCEAMRFSQNSPWYYPVDGDDQSTALEVIFAEAMAYKEGALLDRYTLQAVRALFSLKRFGDAINLWEERKDRLPEGLIKSMIHNYIAGAQFRADDPEKAFTYYTQTNDYESLELCARTLQNLNDRNIIEVIYHYNPNSEAMLYYAEKIVRRQEIAHYEPDHDDKQPFIRLKSFAMRLLSENRTRDKAPWYYLTAWMHALDGEEQEASRLLAHGERLHTTPFIEESIKVLRMYLDAKLLPLGADYDRRMLRHIEWIDRRIVDDLTPEIRQKVVDASLLMYNHTLYYWNDMMRKALTGAMAERYAKAGKGVRALQVANMATYRLLNLVDCHEVEDEYGNNVEVSLAEYRRRCDFNYIDYRTEFFALADTIDLDQLMRYHKEVTKPRDQFGRFTAARSFVSEDFLCDLIGTRCLREERYTEAVDYLAKVSSEFETQLNTYKQGYFNRDPFTDTRSAVQQVDYKYRFAVRMKELQHQMNHTEDSNRRGLLMIEYAHALRNSHLRCWALTGYYYGGVISCSDSSAALQERQWRKAEDRYNKLTHNALELISEPESRCQALLRIGLFSRAKDECRMTRTWKQSGCDEFDFYR